MAEFPRFLAFASVLVFVSSILYSMYAFLRVDIDRRRKLGWGWVGFRSPWSTKELSEEGLTYRGRGLWALAVTLTSWLLGGVAILLGA